MTALHSETFGAAPDGTTVHRWSLERAGTRVLLLTYGGIVQSVEVPDRAGDRADVVLGLPDLAGYLAARGPYFGALIGRYANRIAGSSFTLDGVTHDLPANDGPNCLHGGVEGFDRRVWRSEPVADGVRLSRVSEDGEEGFPGRLDVSVTYTLDAAGALRIDYLAETDAATPVALTNHSYWHLGGAGRGLAVHQHQLTLAAGHMTPVGPDSVPTGELAPVAGTRFDFRSPRTVEPGYDHNFVLDTRTDGAPAAELYAPSTGRVLKITTTEPGIQLYTGDGFDGRPYPPGAGIALETQAFPDSPHHAGFPTTILRPGETYASETTYAFGIR